MNFLFGIIFFLEIFIFFLDDNHNVSNFKPKLFFQNRNIIISKIYKTFKLLYGYYFSLKYFQNKS